MGAKTVTHTLSVNIADIYAKLGEDVHPFPNKPYFLRVSNTGLLKTLWEKEELLVASRCCFANSFAI